jgi:signal transduction histidine kinase
VRNRKEYVVGMTPLFSRDAGIKCRWVFFAVLLAAIMVGTNAFSEPGFPDSVEILTNFAQVRQAIALQGTTNCAVRLEGVVWWINPERDRFIFGNADGGLPVMLNLRDEPRLQLGERIVIAGNTIVSHAGISPELFIDDDGTHASLEKSASTFLSAGFHPISVQWFNGPAQFELSLDCQMPGAPRQPIPSGSLFHAERGDRESARFLPGLEYRDYEGVWTRLPQFSQLPVLKSGIATNISADCRTRNENVGMVFSGFFHAPTGGLYTFWLKSDDGGKFRIGNPLQVSFLRPGKFPAPQKMLSGQSAGHELDWHWVAVEGLVTRVREVPQGVSLELAFGAERIHLTVAAGNYSLLKVLLHCQISVSGVYESACDTDGQTVPSLLVPDSKEITVTAMNSALWVDYPITPMAELTSARFLGVKDRLIHTRGMVAAGSSEKTFSIEDQGKRILARTEQAMPSPGEQVEVLGWLDGSGTNTVLRDGFVKVWPPTTGADSLPLLTKVIQVKSLNRTEAERGYPVRIQGVITALSGSDFVIQDSTWSIFCYWTGTGFDPLPAIGDYWEIEGISGVHFAPDILVERAKYLRPGILPEPIHPTQDAMINSSLDTQYIEMQGIATAVSTKAMRLLTREGKLQFYDLDLTNAKTLEGALVRIRGVYIPDRETNQMIRVRLSPLKLFNVLVSVDEPAPAHPFEMPLKRVSDLHFFDAHADALRRIKIAGQILAERHGEYFLSDGVNGLRFEPSGPGELPMDALVEVVGFPDMSGPSPVLREALVHVTGKARLPEALQLSDNSVPSAKLDARLVTLESRLVSANLDHAEETFELQMGARTYRARLANSNGIPTDILPGSLLELTGVYAAPGGMPMADGNADSFDLLLNSPSDIRVLERPSWWTTRHTLTVVGGMIVVIVAALIWITQLRRQVEERSHQLASEIAAREQAEYQRALEAERARIAQDLHDDLGATLTEIRFLSAVKSRDLLVPTVTRTQLMEVSEKSRQMVSSLDEIVWAVNPSNDSLPSLASYLRHVAEEFFRTTEVRCRMDVDQALPAVALTSEIRHNLYLVVREALNNIAKHAQATEAWLRIHWTDRTLEIVVEDNGRGFADSDTAAERDGLSNMRYRLEKIGGRFECDTRPGAGTICRFYLSLAE